MSFDMLSGLLLMQGGAQSPLGPYGPNQFNPMAGMFTPPPTIPGLGMPNNNPLLGGSLMPGSGLFGGGNDILQFFFLMMMMSGKDGPLNRYPQINGGGQRRPAGAPAAPGQPAQPAAPQQPAQPPAPALELPAETQIKDGRIVLSEAAIRRIAANPGEAKNIVDAELKKVTGEKDDWKILGKVFRPDKPFTHGGQTKSGKKFADIYANVVNKTAQGAVKLADYYNQVNPQPQQQAQAQPQQQGQGQPQGQQAAPA